MAKPKYDKQEKIKQMETDEPEWGQQRLDAMRKQRIKHQATSSKDRAQDSQGESQDKSQGSDEPMEPKYVEPIWYLGERVGPLLPVVAATEPASVSVRDSDYSGVGFAAEVSSADSVGDAAAVNL